MPCKGGKSVSVRSERPKEATVGVETSPPEGRVGEDHDNESHDSEGDSQRRSLKDGGASDKGLIPYEIIDVIIDSPSHVMSKIESVYKSGGSTTYTERFPVQDIGLLCGTSAKVSMMSYDPLIGETLSPELSRIPNVMGLFKESEYDSADFTEDAKLLACKMEVFQRALFTLVRNVPKLIVERADKRDSWANVFLGKCLATTSVILDGPSNYTSKLGKPDPPGSSDAPMVGPSSRLIVEHTDKRDPWACLFLGKFLVTTSVIRGAADLYFPLTPVSAGLGFQHPDLHVGARACLMLLDECGQHTVNNGSRAIANLWGAEFKAHENLVSFVLRVQALRNAVQERVQGV